MQKFFRLFVCLVFICLKNVSFANVSSCHSIFVSGSRNNNITHLQGEKINFFTKDKEPQIGFDIAYFYGLSERIYLGLGVGYFASYSSIFNSNKRHSENITDIVLDGDFLKIPFAIRFYGDDFANILKVYLYGDVHYFCNLSTNAEGDEDNTVFSSLVFEGKKFSLGAAIGAGVNICITPCSNFFAECIFALRPFSAIEMNSDDKIGNLKINSLIVNLGIHLDFVNDDYEKID